MFLIIIHCFPLMAVITLTMASSTRSWSVVILGVIFMYMSMARVYSPFFSHSLPWDSNDSAPLSVQQKQFKQLTKLVSNLLFRELLGFQTLNISPSGVLSAQLRIFLNNFTIIEYIATKNVVYLILQHNSVSLAPEQHLGEKSRFWRVHFHGVL